MGTERSDMWVEKWSSDPFTLTLRVQVWRTELSGEGAKAK